MSRSPRRLSLPMLGLLLLAIRCSAQFEYGISSFTITNYTGYVIAGDTSPSGRQAIRTRTLLRCSNAAITPYTADFALKYRLLDGGGNTVSILDEAGQTNTTYTLYTTNTVPYRTGLLLDHILDVTNGAPLQPLVRLSPYEGYTADLKIFVRPHDSGSYMYLGTNARSGPMVYLDFTNTVSPDRSPNFLLTLDSASLAQAWAISNSPGQGGFVVSAAATVRRYDDFTLPSSPTNTTVALNFQLLDASSGAAIPLQATQGVFQVSIRSHDAGAPPSPASVSLATNFSLVPAVQIDSVDRQFVITVTLAHTEGGAWVADGTNSVGPVQLFAFNGQFQFGSILSLFTNLDGPPVVTNVVPNNHLDCLLPISQDAGWLPNAPDHTFGDGTAISAALYVDGTVGLEPGVVIAPHGPSPDTATEQNISFTRSSVEFTPTGIVAFVSMRLPVGFSVGIGPDNRLTLSTLEYPGTMLDDSLNPENGPLTTPGPLYGIHETLPFWFGPAPSLLWRAKEGQIVLNSGSGAFVRQEEDDLLTNNVGALADPLAARRISNDGYLRGGQASTPLMVTADINGLAQVTAQVALHPPELRPHFPYAAPADGREIVPAPNGLLSLQSGIISSNSFLPLNRPVPVAYARDCPGTNCGTGTAGAAVLAFSPEAGQLTFTPDGGLLGYGSVSPSHLTWGFAGGVNYGQEVSLTPTGAYHMPGIFLTGGQTALALADEPAVLLLTGFGDASNPAYEERPGEAGYLEGYANYAGLNFRAPPQASSYLGQQTVGPYPLTSDSKYYARYGGVSGRHEAQSFPAQLDLYGYNFTFTTYRLSYLDSQDWDSRTDGSIAFPSPPTGPSGFLQEFERMRFACGGALDSAHVPASSGVKHLVYWNVDIVPESIQFNPSVSDPCGTSRRWLVLGVQTTLPFIPQALQAALGFWPNGNLVTVADNAAGCDSRFQIPAQLSLQGPGTSFFPLSTAAEGYFNNWATAGAPPGGFYNIAGSLQVPFFTDIEVHLHVAPTSASNASVSIMGGWPAPNSTAADLGWTVNGSNYFNTVPFDPTSAGFPASQGVTIANYENSGSPQYHPRAQCDWIEVAFFDYPLTWNSVLRQFQSFEPAQVVLPIINVDSQLNQLTPSIVDLNFAQDINLQLPQIKALDFLSSAIGEIDAPLQSFSNAVYSSLGSVFTTAGLNELQQTLNENAQSFFQPMLQAALQPAVDNLFAKLSGFPQTDQNLFLSNAVVALNSSGLASALANLNGAPGQANSVMGQLSQTLSDVQSDLGQFVTILSTNSSGQRPVVASVIQQLVADQAPGFNLPGIIPTDALDSIVGDLGPTLDALAAQLVDLSNQIAQVSISLTSASGDFNRALTEPLTDANALQQFEQFAVADLTNQLAAALTPAGDYFTANPGAARQAIQQQLQNAFLNSTLTSDYQQTLRQFLFDNNATLDQLINALFDQVNGAIRSGFSALLTNATDGVLQDLKGLASGSLLAAQITGSPTFDGDSLRMIHLNAAVQMNLPDPMNFNAYMEILELDSQSVPVDCIPAGAAAAEITLGATDVKLDWASLNPGGTPITISVAGKWTSQGGTVIGLGGSLDIKGRIGFYGCSVNEIGASVAFGATENYFATKAAGTILILGIPVDVQAGVFAGKACSLDPLTFVDPDASSVLGENPQEFVGIYVEYGGGLSLSEILFGQSSCVIDIEVTQSDAVFYDGGASTMKVGMRQNDSMDLSLLCVLSGGADLEMFGSLRHGPGGYALDLGGSAQICGSIGPCPFCVSGCKGITVTGEVTPGGISYHVSY